MTTIMFNGKQNNLIRFISPQFDFSSCPLRKGNEKDTPASREAGSDAPTNPGVLDVFILTRTGKGAAKRSSTKAPWNTNNYGFSI